MNWLQRIFKNTEPTLEQVSAEQAKLNQRREAIRQRLTELETALVAAYGDDKADVEAIHSEASRLERELSTLATVSAELERQRTAAAHRQIIEQTRADLDVLNTHAQRIVELNPRIMELRRELGALVEESNSRRRAVSNMRNGYHVRLEQRTRAVGLDPRETLPTIAPQLDALAAEFNDALNRSFAETVGDAAAIAEAMPSRADASLKG